MPIEYERKFLIRPEAREAALALLAGAPTARILDAYFPPKGGAGPRLRLRVEAPVGEPDPSHAVACVKVPDPSGPPGARMEHEWLVPLPVALAAGATLISKLRATLADLSPPGTVCTLDVYTSPAAAVCPLTGEPLSGPVLVVEVEGTPEAVDAWTPPAGWQEVTGRPEFSAGNVAERGWPTPAPSAA